MDEDEQYIVVAYTTQPETLGMLEVEQALAACNDREFTPLPPDEATAASIMLYGPYSSALAAIVQKSSLVYDECTAVYAEIFSVKGEYIFETYDEEC